MRPPTSSSGARASTSARMWRSPEDTAIEYCPVSCASSQVTPRLSIRSHGWPGSTNLPPRALNNSTAASVEWHPCAQFRSSAVIPPPSTFDVVRLIAVDLLGSADGPGSHVPWRLGPYAEHRPLRLGADVRSAEGERLQQRRVRRRSDIGGGV